MYISLIIYLWQSIIDTFTKLYDDTLLNLDLQTIFPGLNISPIFEIDVVSFVKQAKGNPFQKSLCIFYFSVVVTIRRSIIKCVFCF